MTLAQTTRRSLLRAGAMTTIAGFAFSGTAVALPIDRRLILLDAALSEQENTVAHTLIGALEPQLLEADLVRQWRETLGAQFVRGDRVIAITRWDKAVLLQGLAREASLKVRQSRISRSLFQTKIG